MDTELSMYMSAFRDRRDILTKYTDAQFFPILRRILGDDIDILPISIVDNTHPTDNWEVTHWAKYHTLCSIIRGSTVNPKELYAEYNSMSLKENQATGW